MKTICKYLLNVGSDTIVHMPEGALLLSIDKQSGVPTMWAAIDLSRKLCDRKIVCYRTGFPIYDGDGFLPFLGTVFVEHLVWHYFDGGES